MDSHRQHFCTHSEQEVDELATLVKAALDGDDNDAEHDALVLVAEYLGVLDAHVAYARERWLLHEHLVDIGEVEPRD